MNIYLIAFSSFIISAATTFIFMKSGIRLGFSDVPSERSSHKNIVPKGGGIGIFVVFLIASIIFNIEFRFYGTALFISLLGFYGDKIDLSPLLRLVLHLSAGYIIVSNVIFHDNQIINYTIIIFGTVFIAGTANFYNFMDGIDGIAAITGITAFISLYFYIGTFNPYHPAENLCLSISFSILGFLPFNFPKARIFMGDVGSLLLGISFGSLVLLFSNTIIDFLCLSGFLFTFYCDELITMVIRVLNRDSLTRPHRKHLYQLLVNELEIDHWKISLIYGFFQTLISLTLFFLRNKGIIMILAFYTILFLIMGILYFVVKKEIYKREKC